MEQFRYIMACSNASRVPSLRHRPCNYAQGSHPQALLTTKHIRSWPRDALICTTPACCGTAWQGPGLQATCYEEITADHSWSNCGSQLITTLFRRSGGMAEDEAKRLFCQLLSAAEYLHTLQVLHW